MSSVDIKFKLDGVDELDKIITKFMKMGNEAQVKRAFTQACMYIKSQAKLLCPVDTGRLRQSIAYKVTMSDGAIKGEIGTNVEYAEYIEFGTSKMVAQPFLYPALKDNQEVVINIIKQSLLGSL